MIKSAFKWLHEILTAQGIHPCFYFLETKMKQPMLLRQYNLILVSSMCRLCISTPLLCRHLLWIASLLLDKQCKIPIILFLAVQRVLEQRVAAVLEKLLVKPPLGNLPPVEEGGALLVSHDINTFAF